MDDDDDEDPGAAAAGGPSRVVDDVKPPRPIGIPRPRPAAAPLDVSTAAPLPTPRLAAPFLIPAQPSTRGPFRSSSLALITCFAPLPNFFSHILQPLTRQQEIFEHSPIGSAHACRAR